MYPRIVIGYSEGSAQFGKKNHNSIYEYMISTGCDHDVAADVADWAEIASVGEQYELDGFDIFIVD